MPTGIKVGGAYSTYDLDISGLRRNAAEAKKILLDLQAVSQKVGAQKAQLPGGSTQAAQLQKVKREAENAGRALDRLRDSEVRVARATGDHVRALKLIQTELGRTAQDTVRYNNLLAQQARIQRDLARSNSGSGGGGALSLLRSGAGALGITLGAQQAVQFTGEAIRMANSLERTQVTVRVLSGSIERYNEVLAIARKGQQLYGGTLEENLRGLGSLVNLANRSGASLEQLDNVSRRLAIIDPVQGIEGANIALKEFLTGTGGEAALSLARRFELPRRAIADLAKEGISAKERLEALDQLLADQGITPQVLTERTKTTAQTYTQLGVAVEDAKIAFGEVAAKGLEPAARGLERLIQTALGSKKAIAELRQVLFGETSQEAERGAIGNLIDAERHKTIGSVAFGRQRTTRQGENVSAVRDRVKSLRETMIDIGLADERNIATMARSLQLLAQGAIASSQFEAIIASLAARQRGAMDIEERRAAALANLAVATRKNTDATADGIAQTIADELNTKKAALAKDQLYEAALLASRGLGSTESAAARLAAQFPLTNLEALNLINSLREIDRLSATGAVAGIGGRGGGARPVAVQMGKDADDARRRQIEATETTAQRVARLRRELAGLVTGSAAYIDKQTELILAQRALKAEQEAAAKANARNTKAAISDAQKQLDLTERTTDAIRKQAEAAVDARLALVDDRRKRREEEKRLNQARRVLANPNASAEQRAAALDVLEEVPLLQQKRQLDIQDLQMTAGAALKNGKLYQSIAGGAPPLPGAPVLPTGASVFGAVPAPIAAPVPTMAPVLNLSIAVYLDGDEIASRVEMRANDGVIVRLQEGLQKAKSAGTIKRGG